ncbi:MAG: ferritin [Anaerolineae bacterium]|nr:ferritin [Anaerolineae bacterium]
MLSKAMIDKMNDQIKNELYSAYLYLSMCAYFEDKDLPGFAHWMKIQAGEEQEHAMKFFEYLTDRGARVSLQAIDQPPAEFETPTAVFEETLAHEKKVTALIHSLYELAVSEKDYASQEFLNWFVKEQVEEEKNASAILATLKMTGDKGSALVMLDRELGKRDE